jgi:hypothetical protein
MLRVTEVLGQEYKSLLAKGEQALVLGRDLLHVLLKSYFKSIFTASYGRNGLAKKRISETSRT